ncbi:MAG: macro domain-containing protein [Methanocellales archaeon]|nr:macro domain-containing protein [Methanocellales archaeon]
MTIIVKKGDITKMECDAIVNPANSYGHMGGGVAGAIRREGEVGIEKEAMDKAPIPVGKAIGTKAGKLRCRYVIHSPTMERPVMKIGVENVKKAMRAALSLAKELGIKSIAIPGMGTGVGGVARDEAARVMFKVARQFEKDFEILFVDHNEKMVEALKKCLSSVMIS